MRADDAWGQLWLSEYLTPSHRIMHRIRKVLVTRETAFQSMQIVQSADFGKALLLDGTWQSATVDEFIYHESLVHPAMLAAGTPRRVLVLGGGEGATSREALRWASVERVVMVDIDGEVVEECRTHLPEMHGGAFDDERHELIVGDALEYVEECKDRFDVVVSDLSDPVEDGPAFQLFAREYFERVRGVMDPHAVLSLQAGPVSPADHGIYVRLVNTVASCFAHVRSYVVTVPSFGTPWGFIIASAEPLQAAPDPAKTDATLQAQLQAPLLHLDGAVLRGVLSLPPWLRRAITNETRVYTMADPPKLGQV